MSYARMGADSDVYVYRSLKGSLVCCACRLNDSRDWEMYTDTQGVIIHLIRHVRKGHKVPTRAVIRLWKELRKESKE